MKSPSLLTLFICCALLAPQGYHISAADRLAAAIQSGTATDVAAQLNRGADPNWNLVNGETPLAFTILRGRYRNAEALLAHGANPNSLDHGMSMLSLIVQTRNCPAGTVVALLAAGADPNRHDSISAKTPLLTALQSGAEACAEALLSHGADIKARDSAGGSGLDAAVRGSSARMVEQVIAAGLEVNAVMAQRTTPLMWAALRPRDARATPEAVIAILLAHGADPCIRDVRRMTAADYARIMGFQARASRLATACAKWQVEHRDRRRARADRPQNGTGGGTAGSGWVTT